MIYREQGMQTSILPWLFLMHASRSSINTCYSQHSFSLNTNHFLKHRPFLFIAVNFGRRKCEHSIVIRPKDRETQRLPCKEVNKQQKKLLFASCKSRDRWMLEEISSEAQETFKIFYLDDTQLCRLWKIKQLSFVLLSY